MGTNAEYEPAASIFMITLFFTWNVVTNYTIKPNHIHEPFNLHRFLTTAKTSNFILKKLVAYLILVFNSSIQLFIRFAGTI